MYQLIALFRKPADEAAFNEAYHQTHVPLAKKIPGLVRLDVSRIIPGRDGSAAYYQMAILNFADKETFKTAMKSAENAAAGVNLNSFAAGLVEFYSAETQEIP